MGQHRNLSYPFQEGCELPITRSRGKVGEMPRATESGHHPPGPSVGAVLGAGVGEFPGGEKSGRSSMERGELDRAEMPVQKQS